MSEAERKETRGIATSFGVIFSAFGGFEWSKGATDDAVWFFVIGLGLILLGWTIPIALRPFARGWMWLAARLAWINTRVILGLFYYVVVTPVGLFMRLRGDPLERRIERKKPSYWIRRVSSKPIDYSKQY